MLLGRVRAQSANLKARPSTIAKVRQETNARRQEGLQQGLVSDARTLTQQSCRALLLSVPWDRLKTHQICTGRAARRYSALALQRTCLNTSLLHRTRTERLKICATQRALCRPSPTDHPHLRSTARADDTFRGQRCAHASALQQSTCCVSAACARAYCAASLCALPQPPGMVCNCTRLGC